MFRKQESSSDAQDLLPHFPEDLLRYTFFSKLSLYTKAQLAQHPQFSYLSHYKTAPSELESRANQLRWLVARGRQREAELMLRQDPELLLCKGQTTDYSGRVIEGTALQIALGAKDVGIQEDEECMVEMIQRYLKTLPNGDTEIVKQYDDQFPKNWETEEIARNERDLAELTKIVDAIAKAAATTDTGLEEELKSKLNTFRDYLKPKGVITQGTHFNNQLLVAAFQSYDDNYVRFGNDYDNPKNKFFWQKVIGYIQRFVPACDAQAVCQGLYWVTEGRKKLRRSMTLNTPADFIFLLIQILHFGWDIMAVRFMGAVADDGSGVETYKIYVDQKYQHCENLCNGQAVNRRDIAP